MDRDAQGRFLPGNQLAKGNKGNRYPKWGNKNALKHGLYETRVYINQAGYLVIGRGDQPPIMLPPSTFIKEKDYFLVSPDVLQKIKNIAGK